jgi:hypothetical protein
MQHTVVAEKPMSEPAEPIQIQLTEEQQQLIRRLSGQYAQVLELTPDAADPAAGEGRALQFRWRLSVASGIPRQAWGTGAKPPVQDAEGNPQG